MGNYYIGSITSPYRRELWHYGVPNQKWGVRNYQNLDGSLTQAGRVHYGIGPGHSDDEEDETGDVASQIKSMVGQLQDPETEKELDYYISNVKSGRMSAEEALAAAQQAVQLDHERAAYKQKKAAAEQKKANKAAGSGSGKRRSGGGSSGGKSSSKKSDDESKKKKEYNIAALERDTQQRNLISQIEGILRKAKVGENGESDGSSSGSSMDILSQLRSAAASSGSTGAGLSSVLSGLGARVGNKNNSPELQSAYDDILKLIQNQYGSRVIVKKKS